MCELDTCIHYYLLVQQQELLQYRCILPTGTCKMSNKLQVYGFPVAYDIDLMEHPSRHCIGTELTG